MKRLKDLVLLVPKLSAYEHHQTLKWLPDCGPMFPLSQAWSTKISQGMMEIGDRVWASCLSLPSVNIILSFWLITICLYMLFPRTEHDELWQSSAGPTKTALWGRQPTICRDLMDKDLAWPTKKMWWCSETNVKRRPGRPFKPNHARFEDTAGYPVSVENGRTVAVLAWCCRLPPIRLSGTAPREKPTKRSDPVCQFRLARNGNRGSHASWEWTWLNQI